MKRSNLIPITRIYDIYPKYTYSKDVRRFMDDIVDIDRADVYSKEEVIAILEEIQKKINNTVPKKELIDSKWVEFLFQHYIDELKGNDSGNNS